jgi:hypothetical protein
VSIIPATQEAEFEASLGKNVSRPYHNKYVGSGGVAPKSQLGGKIPRRWSVIRDQHQAKILDPI